MDIKAIFPEIIPHAVAWAEIQAQHAALVGNSLTQTLEGIARRVGVQHPELVRVKLVDSLPMPEEPLLKRAAKELGLFGPEMAGITLGYGIFVVHDHYSLRLLSHEFRHVHQYETLGSTEQFLGTYLRQLIDFGYYDAPLEIDARNHELTLSTA